MKIKTVIFFLFCFLLTLSNSYAEKDIIQSRQEKIQELASSVIAKKNAESDIENGMDTYKGQRRERKSFKRKCLSSVGVLAGFVEGPLDSKDNYQVIPLLINFGLDLRALAEKIGIKTKGILELGIEPYIGYVANPDQDIEAGLSFLVKYGVLLNNKLMPYIRIGAGLVYLGLDTNEQGSEFNFIDSAGLGFSWFLKEDISIDCEYRFRHISNAGFDKPNRGIDTNSVYAGVTYRFE